MNNIHVTTATAALAALVTIAPNAIAQRRSVPRDTTTQSLGQLQLLSARSIGPAVTGGRVSSLAWDPKETNTFYVGLGMAGVMKTTDGGTTFRSIFEPDGVASIGDVAVAPSDPKVVWVGTGEANDRNTSSWGSGVYRSTDAGHTWTHVGLDSSKTIARIAVHPTDSKVAYVAVPGDLWMPNSQRGLYKTTDAGTTWKKILSAPAPYDNRVGAGDVAIDPSNPNIVYAALYARQRRPWGFYFGKELTDGKDLGGIFKSTDGGATWRKLTNGLPTQTGRIGFAIAPSNPSVVYAIVQSDEGGQQGPLTPESRFGGVFRSDDGGEHWTRKSGLDSRPWYFSQIRVDPKNDARIYNLGMTLFLSADSGRTWREDVSKHVHSDLHALLIDPADPSHLVLGTDGGVYQSRSMGATWDGLMKFAAGEVRRVTLDPLVAHRLCIGLQDNNALVGSTEPRTDAGITNGDWLLLGGGDGSYCTFDPADSNVVYWTSQQQAWRTNLATGASLGLRPEVTEGRPLFHYNWAPPLVGSLHNKGVVYIGSNVVFKLTDDGKRVTPISPDLTSGKHQAATSSTGPSGNSYDVFGTITDMAESPVAAGVIWAGTDDGKLWRTSGDETKWTDLSANLPAIARDHWINRVEPSHKSVDVAYVAVGGHRDGIYEPLLYRTADGGRTWQDISSNMRRDEPVRVIREDPDNPNVLYAGTERRLWFSNNLGRSWVPLGNLPPVAVEDIAIDPTTHDIVIATQGRSLYVIDQARALAQLTPDVLDEELHLFTPVPLNPTDRLNGFTSVGDQFAGEGPPSGAVFTYYVKRAVHGQPVRISITDATGVQAATLTGPAKPGINRVTWTFRPTGGGSGGLGQLLRRVPGGVYTVTMTYGSARQTYNLTVPPAP